MRASKAAAAPTSATVGRRAQPVRQTRTNPPRSSARAGAGSGGTRRGGEAAVLGQNVGPSAAFFPAITHFTDCMSAIPRETIRNFALLKEVDAKAVGPERSLQELTDLALSTPAPNPRADERSVALSNSPNGISPPARAGPESQQAHADRTPQPADDAAGVADLPRRQLFLNLRLFLTEALLTLDEKNHVIGTATEGLELQLARANTSLPYIDNEISEEARLGSLNHWAYSDRSNGRTNGVNTTATERSRRDASGANTLAAAAAMAASHEEAVASRSEMRREAMLAKKSKAAQPAADAAAGHGSVARQRDGAPSQPAATGTVAKRGNGTSRSRKAVDMAGVDSGPTVPNGVMPPEHQPNKRRKTEKSALGRAAAESMAAKEATPEVAEVRSAKRKGDARSPSATAVAEPAKKRVRSSAAANASHAKKRDVETPAIPSPAVLLSSVNEDVNVISSKDVLVAGSPVPFSGPRPPTARARQNSAHSVQPEPSPAVNGRRRPSSSASTKLHNQSNGTSVAGGGVESEQALPPAKRVTVSESRSSSKTASTNPKPLDGGSVVEQGTKTGRGGSDGTKSGASARSKGKGNSDNAIPQQDDSESNHSGTLAPPAAVNTTMATTSTTTISAIPTTTRGASRSSKTSTPVSATFPEIPRARPSRAGAAAVEPAPTTTKRSHKKGAGVATASTAPALAIQQNSTIVAPSAQPPAVESRPATGASRRRKESGAGETPKIAGLDGSSDEPDENDNTGISEPRYCYCNQVSYGSMVACDADDCAREWFHLSCVGLTKPPGKNEVWFCDECKDNASRQRASDNESVATLLVIGHEESGKDGDMNAAAAGVGDEGG
ncbi:MAG: hypothetical protein M1826_000712 [Phylliscum demangeonii]|nr:MAG: hypothetical protein M1826_000712 [Phylliscum demangeonii]